MKKTGLIFLGALSVMTLISACNDSDNEQTFSSFTSEAISDSADSEPRDINSIDFIFDNDTDETAYDAELASGSFST